MQRKKLTGMLLAALMVVAFAGIATSSASAAFTLGAAECTGGTNVDLCWESGAGKFSELEGTEKEKVAGVGGVVFKINTAPNVVIECGASSGSGTVSQVSPLTTNGKIAGTLTYEKCKIGAPAEIVTKCVIPEKKETKALSGELKTTTELLLKPETGTVFIEIPFTSKEGQTCPATVKGTRSVTGEQQVTIVNKSEVKKTGEAVLASKLEFFSQKAELTQTLTLTFETLTDNNEVVATA